MDDFRGTHARNEGSFYEGKRHHRIRVFVTENVFHLSAVCESVVGYLSSELHFILGTFAEMMHQDLRFQGHTRRAGSAERSK